MSYHRLSVKPLNVTLNTLLKRVAHVGLGIGAFTPILALANPTGGQVVAGQATIASPNANGLVINQASQSAIINWQQFSIGKGQYVQFLQPSSSSVVLNRVVGGNASSILGSLSANGQVFLVNPNGIFFGKSASLDVQGIVASTLDINNSDFLSGNYVFDKGSSTADASVVNQGTISTHNGGYVVLAGDYAENDGIIQARSGHVVLASGAKTTLTLSGNSLVNFAVNSATLAQLAGTDNTGSLIADGGTVVMTADVANQLKATVVNNTGLIEAQAISKNNGAIYLTAIGGNLTNAGTLDADAGHAAQAGGDIVLKADGLTDLTDTSKITATGNGANGGSLEISGRSINVRGTATLGKGGNMLLDPGSVSISAGTKASTGHASINSSVGHIGVGFIENALNHGTSVAISAHNRIFANSAVTAITATGGAGALKLKSGHSIELSGVNINIAGDLTASMGYGEFGYLQAGAVTMCASAGSIALQNAVTNSKGSITKYSVKATTGGLSISATQLHVFGETGPGLGLDAAGALNLATDITTFTGQKVVLLGKSVDDTGSIDARGAVTVTASNGALSIGNIRAEADVNLTAKGGKMHVGSIADRFSSGGAVTLAASGGSMVVGEIRAKDAVSITDTTANVRTGQILTSGGAVTVNAAGHSFSIDSRTNSSPAALHGGNVDITANVIKYSGPGTFEIEGFGIKPSDGITINGAFGDSNGDFSHELELITDDSVKLDHSVNANGGLLISGGQLLYTGKNTTFSLSAAAGDLALDIAIGTAAAPVKYNVNLTDTGGAIRFYRSIYTGTTAGKAKANLTATAHYLASGAAQQGVFAQDSGGILNVTLSAKGNITLKGPKITVGGVFRSLSNGNLESINLIAGKNILFSASGHSSKAGDVSIIGGNVFAIQGGVVSDAVLVQAGGNIAIKANDALISGNGALAYLGGGQKTLTVISNVTLTAAGSVGITGNGTGGSEIRILGGQARAYASGDLFDPLTRSATADANVSITAGTNINVQAHDVVIQGGNGNPNAVNAKRTGEKVTTDDNSNVTIQAGHDLIVLANSSTGSVKVAGGSAGNAIAVTAAASGAHDIAVIQDTVTLGAGNSLLIGGAKLLQVQGGAKTGYLASVSATQKGAVASLTADASVNLSAKIIQLAAGDALNDSVQVHGGDSAGLGAQVNATAASVSALMNLQTGVNVKATGSVELITRDVDVRGGDHAASMHVGTAGSQAAKLSITGAKDVAGITVNAGISVTAAHTVLLTGFSGADVVGGTNAGAHMSGSIAAAATGATATVTINAGVAIKAGGEARISADTGAVHLGGGVDAGSKSKLHVDAGTLNVTDTAALNVTGASIKMSNGSATFSVGITGGHDAGRSAAVVAQDAGKTHLTADASVTLDATLHGITLAARGLLDMGAGSQDAYKTKAEASYGGSAGFTGKSGVTLDAVGTLTVSAGGALQIRSGDFETASAASAYADGIGAVAKLNAAASIGVIAASATLTAGGNASIAAAFSNARAAKATAIGKATASVTDAAGLSVTTTGIFEISAKGALSLLAAGGGDLAIDNAEGVGAVANMSVNRNLSIAAGGSITLTAVHALSLDAGGSLAAASAVVSAGRDGKATYLEAGAISLTTSKLLTVTGDSVQASAGKAKAAYAVEVHAGSGGVAAFTADDSLNIKAQDVTFIGSRGIKIAAGSHAGSLADILAGSKAKATLAINDDVNIAAPGTVIISGEHGDASINGAQDSLASITAKGTDGGVAAVTGNGYVSIKGSAIRVTATGMLNLKGGNLDAVKATAEGEFAGTATIIDKASMNFTAAASFSAGLLSGSDYFVDITGGNSTGLHAEAETNHGGTAKLNANASMNIAVTGTGGVIRLTTGNSAPSSTGLTIGAGENTGKNLVADASHGGAASASANASVNIAAKGAVTITTHIAKLTIAGDKSTGYAGLAEASGNGAAATLITNSAVSITGGSITLSDIGGKIYINGGSANVGFAMGAHASDGAAANTDADANVSLTATGALSAKALDVYLESPVGFTGRSMDATAAFGGKTSGVATTNLSLTAGGNLSLTASDKAFIVGAANVGVGDIALASSDAVAKLTAQGDVTIHAGGTFTESAAGDAFIEGGIDAGDGVKGKALGATASVSVTSQATVAITATGAVTIKAATAGHASDDGFKIASLQEAGAGGSMLASDGGATVFTAASRLSITAGGNISLSTKGPALTISDGGMDGLNLKGSTDHGKETITLTSGVAMTAGAALTLSLNGGNLSIITKPSDGGHESFKTGPLATSKVSVASSLTLKAATKLTFNSVDNLTVMTGAFPNAPVLTDNSGGVATDAVNDGISLLGASVTVHTTGTVTDTPATGLTSGGLTEKAPITVTGGIGKLSFTPEAINTRDILSITLTDAESTTLQAGSATSGMSFGTRQNIGDISSALFTAPITDDPAHLSMSDGLLVSGGEPATLGTLATMGLVMELVTVTSSVPASLSDRPLDVTLQQGIYGNAFTPGQGVIASLGSAKACSASLVRGDVASRCLVQP